MSAGSNLPVRVVVIHATCPDVGYPAASKKGAASGTAKYFAQESSGGSAHYVEGVDREEHCVPDDRIAWHAPPNPHKVGIEITADGGDPAAFRVRSHAYTREQWLSAEVWPAVARAADRTRELCLRHKIPMRRLTVAQVRAGAAGICGHVDVSLAFGQSTHSDPGPNFPWDRFMARVLTSTISKEDDVSAEDVWTALTPRPKNTPASAGAQLGAANVNSWRAAQGVARLEVQVAGLTSALQAIAAHQGADSDAILAAVKEATDAGVKAALADIRITLTQEPS